MAKHQALGRGLDALLAEDQDNEKDESLAPELEEDVAAPVRQELHNDIPEQTVFAQSPSEQESKTEETEPEKEVEYKGENLDLSDIHAALPKGITADSNGTLWVNPQLLKPNPRQPRQYFDEDKLSELTESVRNEGVLSPIIIEDAGDGTFYIIAGERRTRASKAAGLEKVPVQLRKYSDSRKLEVALIENIQRTDLNPVEEAQAYYQLMELESITQDEVSKRVGKNRSTVANSIRLLKLPEDMLHALASGSISSGHARALLSVINPADQRVLFGRIVGQGLSVRQAEQQSRELNEGGRAGKKASKPSYSGYDRRDPDFVNIESHFIERLGTKVQMKGDFNKGTITIDYFTKDDLDRIYEIILGQD